MRVVGFLVATMVIVWVVGTLFLYIRGRRGSPKGHLPDSDAEAHRRRRDDHKVERWFDQPPPW